MQNLLNPTKGNVNITSPPIISFVNHKGGVGKTTSTINIAGVLATLGLSVVIYDTDPQGNASKTMIKKPYDDLMLEIFQGNDPEPLPTGNKNIFIIPTTKKLTTITDTLSGDFTKLFRLRDTLSKTKTDIVLIDTPPTLTGISVAAQLAATHTIMPISPHFYSLQGANDLMSNYRQIKEHLNKDLEFLGVLITDYDKRTTLAKEIKNEIEETFKDKTFSTIISKSVIIEEAVVNGKTVNDMFPKSEITKQYFRLTDEILIRLKGLDSTRFTGGELFAKEFVS